MLKKIFKKKPDSKKKEKIKISVIVINFNMERELPRTIFSLQAPYQIDISNDEIEIIVVDNGSKEIPKLPKNVQIFRVNNPNYSPAKAVNLGLKHATGEIIGVLVDGARLASPGLLKYAKMCHILDNRAIIGTLGFHLGFNLQQKSVLQGYNQEVEDELLKRIAWQEQGYKLFEISVFAGSSKFGWFVNGPAESNALFMASSLWKELGGYDERFLAKGGGLVNLDVYNRALQLPNATSYILLGEATFHQVHGGISTNQNREDATIKVFNEEYKQIHGKYFKRVEQEPIWIGKINAFHKKSLETTFNNILNG